MERIESLWSGTEAGADCLCLRIQNEAWATATGYSSSDGRLVAMRTDMQTPQIRVDRCRKWARKCRKWAPRGRTPRRRRSWLDSWCAGTETAPRSLAMLVAKRPTPKSKSERLVDGSAAAYPAELVMNLSEAAARGWSGLKEYLRALGSFDAPRTCIHIAIPCLQWPGKERP